MKLGKIFTYLLSSEEKEQLAQKEIEFLKTAIQTREAILEQINTILPSCKNVKDLAKALETLSNEIKSSYKKLAKKYHPDKVSHLGEEIKKAAEVKITAINAAYDAIKDERGLN